jgi:glycine cleavage system H protein
MDLRYSREHEWVSLDGDVATIGVTEYAAGEMGDVVFLELPEEGSEVSQGDPVGTIETVKSVEDLFTPLSGEIVEINESILDEPELVNQNPLEGGWLFKIKLSNSNELDSLLDATGYSDLIGG